jgi:hypothetical protein
MLLLWLGLTLVLLLGLLLHAATVSSWLYQVGVGPAQCKANRIAWMVVIQ